MEMFRLSVATIVRELYYYKDTSINYMSVNVKHIHISILQHSIKR